MSALDHPGIARVLGTGEANGHPFFVMERIVGLTLDVHVRTHATPLRERLALFASACDAVHYAHGKGVIHRDLKPANIMVRSDGTVVVLDFGVARATMFSGATRPGDFLGTPLYMSPEQAMARPDEVDARTDVYSLGVTLFEVIADRPPFDLIGLSFPASIRTILQQPPPPLDHDAELDAIVARTLAKKSADRHPSAAALAAELRDYLARSL
jgi:serine/threonine protein kinase